MAEPYEIQVEAYQRLGYDLQVDIDKYTSELAAHALTEGVAAPTTTSEVENIVKYHDGLFVIVQAPKEAPNKQPLPKDAKYYKSTADKVGIETELEREAKEKTDFEKVKANRLAALTAPEEVLPPDIDLEGRLNKLEANITEIMTLLKK